MRPTTSCCTALSVILFRCSRSTAFVSTFHPPASFSHPSERSLPILNVVCAFSCLIAVSSSLPSLVVSPIHPHQGTCPHLPATYYSPPSAQLRRNLFPRVICPPFIQPLCCCYVLFSLVRPNGLSIMTCTVLTRTLCDMSV